MLTDKEKLGEELKLLEESLHLEVITKEEYEEAKQRVERKLKSLEKKAERLETKAEKKIEEVKIKEIKREEIREVTKAEEEKEEEETPSEENNSEEEPEEEKVEEETAKSAEEIAAEQVRKAAGEAEIREEAEKDEESVPLAKPEERKEEDSFELSKGSMKVLIYAVAILVLAFGSYFFFFSGNPDDNTLSKSTVFIACSSDKDCKKEGSIGTCNNPGAKDAECAYAEDVEVKLTLLNDNSCFNCDAGRVLSILNEFFPNLDIENFDIGSNEGKKIAERFGIAALPAYILNSSLQQASNYHKFFSAFNIAGDSFVMKNTVANSNFYIERGEIPGKLDLILKDGQAASTEAEKNLQEFLNSFKGKVDFEKHSDNSALAKELGINTFPVFLVNNEVKFSGVQAADVIKDNFCQMNDLEECGLELSKSLI
ncbi:MAG: hypothetical protein AABX63_01390 [Nanoarchaeota archaeon]